MAATRASNDRPPGAGGVKRGRQQQEAAATGSRVTVVLGAQWGDEGKGKVVDLLATDADIISRCQVRGPPPRGPPTSQTPRGRGLSPSSQGHLPSATPTRSHALPFLRGTPLPQGPRLPHPAPPPPHPAVGRGRAINTSPAELGTPDPQGVGCAVGMPLALQGGRRRGPQLLGGLRTPGDTPFLILSGSGIGLADPTQGS